MKRFITVFATLVMGATLFTTAMAQGKPAVHTPAKKHVAIHAIKKSPQKSTMAKKAAIRKKVAAKKWAMAKSHSHKAIPKAKARKAMVHTSRAGTSHSSPLKMGGKRISATGKPSMISATKVRRVNNGMIKSKSAPKAGKVVNRR